MLTWILIAVTGLVSFLGFTNHRMVEKLQFNAAKIIHQKQYHRLVSHAFLHAGWTHLFVNMFVLYFFGRAVESYFASWFGNKATFLFLLLYLGGVLVSNLYSLVRQRDNYYYNAIGASGAVSAVLFAFIFFNPWEKLYFFGLFPIPGILFAAGYLIYSWYMSKRESDNVAHDAHFLGAVFGFVFPILIKPELFGRFIDHLFRLL
ncbi:MAG: rhomboid family intramembrane serine protease [Prolixibacteraceae bacterium]|nr:rhomboid family intramembrane serine protease [Prolixibacteraceae bacterium]MDI9564290.1 rhomboid family intramembrane serine protease [Bacteroidota bacterium]NLS99214.1 rhomboid family intramembrane serine protease [Bacteroidales bacterium]OQB79642.1 MAG: Rhomboid family protein [Bacteroidetes bacterium ADurb.Bin123]HNZ68028.1 rhomboid family intramembrane serine protease [Prolixibacteraceae bacterium]